MLIAETEVDPRAQRYVEGFHNLGSDAFFDEVVVGDSHASHRCAIALETPKLREVDPEVCQGVHRKHCHVWDVCQHDPPTLDPLCYRRLYDFQLLGLYVERSHLAPCEGVLFDVLPAKCHRGLIEPPKQSHTLPGRYFNSHHTGAARIYIFRPV